MIEKIDDCYIINIIVSEFILEEIKKKTTNIDEWVLQAIINNIMEGD